MHEILRFDSEELKWKQAIAATIALGITVIVIGVVGPVGVAAGLAALFVVAAGPSDAGRVDGWSVGVVVAGVVVTLVVGSVAASSVVASIVVAVLAAATTFAVAWGQRFAEMGVFVLLWGVIALTIELTSESVVALAAWFGAGGLIAILAASVAERVGSGSSPDSATDQPRSTAPPGAPSISPALTIFAVLRGIGTGAFVLLGYVWFPDHLAWAAIAFVIVLRPPEHGALVVGIGRMLGTVAGVLLGMLIAEIIGENLAAQVIAFVVAGFLVAAFNKVNYALFTLCVTTLLLVAEQILRDGVVTAAWERLVATLVGVGLAFLVIFVLIVLARTSRHEQRRHTRTRTAP